MLTNEEIQRVVVKSLQTLNGFPLPNTKHPVNYFARADIDDKTFDAAYDLYTDEWVKPPSYTPLDFDPELVFPEVWDEAVRLAQSWDIEMGELRRDIVEYRDILHSLSHTGLRHTLEKRLMKKLAKIDQSLNTLIADLKELRDRRHEAFSRDPDTVREVWMASRNWMPENILYKLEERWGYLKLLNDLREVWDSDAPDSERVEDVAERLL
jgi:DNA-binding cell septation regulator SpoVG